MTDEVRGGEAAEVEGWERFLTARDRLVFEAAGYGRQAGLSRRAALLLIDVTYAFCGDRPEPILDSIRRWRNSSGAQAWQAVAVMQLLRNEADAVGIPVIYTRGSGGKADPAGRGRWTAKNQRSAEDPPEGHRIVEPLAPREGETVIVKSKPSAFFGTDLTSRLIDAGVDTVVVGGGTTSGCVRASVVDAFSYNFRVGLVADACFDRGEASHWVSLFDMNMKYADVISSAAALSYLAGLGA